MITYYDDRSVQVTSTAVRVDGPLVPARRDSAWSGTGGAAAPGGCSPAGARSAPRWPGRWSPPCSASRWRVWLHRSPTVTSPSSGRSVLVGLAVGPLADFLFEHLDRSYARGSRQLEMWARWRGQPVRLLPPVTRCASARSTGRCSGRWSPRRHRPGARRRSARRAAARGHAAGRRCPARPRTGRSSRRPAGDLSQALAPRSPRSLARRHVCASETTTAPELARGVLVLLLSLPPLVALVCVVSLAWSAQDRGNWKLALIILAAFAVAGLALTPFLELPLGWLDRSYERGNRVHELWVQHHGREVLLLRTPDALGSAQIYRAANARRAAGGPPMTSRCAAKAAAAAGGTVTGGPPRATRRRWPGRRTLVHMAIPTPPAGAVVGLTRSALDQAFGSAASFAAVPARAFAVLDGVEALLAPDQRGGGPDRGHPGPHRPGAHRRRGGRPEVAVISAAATTAIDTATEVAAAAAGWWARPSGSRGPPRPWWSARPSRWPARPARWSPRRTSVAGRAAGTVVTAEEAAGHRRRNCWRRTSRRCAGPRRWRRRFVEQLSHEEVTAAIRLVDELPKLKEHLTADILPILATLDRVGPDLHDLLDVTRDLKLAVAGIPGLGMLRRRGERLSDEPADSTGPGGVRRAGRRSRRSRRGGAAPPRRRAAARTPRRPPPPTAPRRAAPAPRPTPPRARR